MLFIAGPASQTVAQHWNNVGSCLLGHLHGWYKSAIQSQKAVSAYFTREQILPFGFAGQSCTKHCTALILLSINSMIDRVLLTTEMKWNESGFRPPLCTYRLNWARRTSWGWWDDWDDTVLQTQDSKFEPWRSEAEHATSRSRRLPTILTIDDGMSMQIYTSLKWTV